MQPRDPDPWPRARDWAGVRDDAGPARRITLALLPLRAFLGFTFCFAGLQKLANPGFFDASNPASIQAQLAAALRSSPVHALIAPLAHQPVALGVLIACGELAVGLGTLAGLWGRVAAAGGLVLSLMLFLTVSFHASPYYTGSDIVFVFAWTPLLLAGSGDVLSVDGFLRRRQEVQSWPGRAGPSRAMSGQAGPGRSMPGHAGPGIGRRSFTAEGAAAGVLALVAVGLGGMAAVIGRLADGPARRSATPALGAGTRSAGPTGSPDAAPTRGRKPGKTRPRRPAGTRIGPASAVPMGGAASFTDPSTGDPSLVVQPSPGRFLAFDAVCPHAGCAVSYQPGSRLFVCPCHGSEFNGRTGAVIVGPAPRGLSRIQVAKGPGGQLYVS
jgi:thiosulfate dehydrogenase [quinone] large subunit